MKHKTAIIGSGFAGLSAASVLASKGIDVELFEKNDLLGGRARQFSTDNGYVFDMGPSWYWMPEIFERYFELFGKSCSDYFDLKLLDPSFTMIFGDDTVLDIPSDFTELCALFDKVEPGAGKQLVKFMDEAGQKYRLGVDELMYRPSLSLTEFANQDLFKGFLKLQVFSSFSKHVKKHFKNPKLVSLMEFPVLFLGAMPEKTPALYSLMNYAGLKMGTWYPMGGFGKVIEGMQTVAETHGVKFHTSSPVTKINTELNQVTSIESNGKNYPFDSVIATADYHHVESRLLSSNQKNYSEKYWDKKTFAPSCLIYYIGINKKVERLKHHNLFFDEDLKPHSKAIYIDKKWPEKPLFYVCCPSKTDESVAPEGHENLFLLVPIAIGLQDDENTREKYFKEIMERLAEYVGEDLVPHIDYKKSYCVSDFQNDYNAFKGNAYGLANTLMQTGTFKPKMVNKKISNLYYAGQLTVPGPGVPPSIISGQIAADLLMKKTKYINHEVAV